ncbi:MAG: metal ABC transporter permease [Verrucomicrobia bacterium]|nr:metal ABC transporter permease [Verrucomicrobiota bacterium]MDA0904758.1 metal ABC transporter permease [Verrucomicrobiota bacterium]MDA1077701.1 metal ABC transporter permease [Verrucomicrobiota bacterium]
MSLPRINFSLLGLLSFGLISSSMLHANQPLTANEEAVLGKALVFLSFQDPSLRVMVLGVLLMGLNCGLMGGYIVTRRLSMFGDTLSHAVLPGIAVGYSLTQSKNNWALMLGATFSGFAGVWFISFLSRHTKIKTDSAMAIVLSGFYALGICLIAYLQKSDGGGVANLENYLFGSIVGFSQGDLLPIVCSLILVLGTFVLFSKELLATGFDPSFARSIGLPVGLLEFSLSALLTFCIVSSLQIIGVVLVSALLIIPAATAALITIRMDKLLLLSGVLGAVSGFTGCFISFLKNGLPVGPVITLCSASIFLTILWLHPSQGRVCLWARSFKRNQKIRLENTLKACYQVLEELSFLEESFPQSLLGKRRGKSSGEIEREIDALVRHGYATRVLSVGQKQSDLPPETMITLTPSGWELACKMIRNHRLWELYLTQEASYAADHVHDDAEKIEHIIGEKTIRQLERILSNPRLDPHGKLIPSQLDIESGWTREHSSP